MNGMWVACLAERKGLEIGTRSCEVQGWAEGAVFPQVNWGSEMEFESIFRWKMWNYGLN